MECRRVNVDASFSSRSTLTRKVDEEVSESTAYTCNLEQKIKYNAVISAQSAIYEDLG
jgi:hypothetical protein